MKTSPTSVDTQIERARFNGFVRADGRVGTRNHIGIFVAGNCAATAARKVAEYFTESRLSNFPRVDGVVPFIHEIGCGMEMTGEPMDLLRRTLSGTIRNPNIFGAVVIALGCERNNVRGFFAQENLEVASNLHMIVLQEVGGTANAIAAGIAAVEAMLPAANECVRQPASAEHLVVGLQTSTADAAPNIAEQAIGAAMDILIENGGTVILAETTSLLPVLDSAGGLVAASPEVEKKIEQRIMWWRGYQEGRDTTLTRRIQRAAPMAQRPKVIGHSPIRAYFEYGEKVTEKGVVFMDSPSYEATSATGQIAGGATMLCVNIDKGWNFDSAAVPSVKVALDASVTKDPEDVDVDCSASSASDLPALGRHLFEQMLAHASGEPTRGEEFGLGENSFVPWSIGVMA